MEVLKRLGELREWAVAKISHVGRCIKQKFRKILTGNFQVPQDSDETLAAQGTKEAVTERLEQEIVRFRREALAYCLYIEATRQSVPGEARRALKLRFGEVFSAPVLELTEVFQTRDEHALSEGIMRKWLERQGHIYDGSAGTATQLEEYLLEEARKRAVDEVQKATRRR